MQKASLYKKMDDKKESRRNGTENLPRGTSCLKVQCLACKRKCIIIPNASGFCGVRKNIDGDLFLMVYGKAIAVHNDPIEKKPFFHFLPGASAFSFGTIGCNFRCTFCQNWDISQITTLIKSKYKNPDEAELMLGKICEEGQKLSPTEIVDYCVKNKIPVIAYTYNEPTIFTEYAADTAKLARKKNIKNVYVSNGYESDECLEFMKDWCDAINIDIKAFNEGFYSDVCGGVKLSGVLESVKKAWELGIWVECTTLIIPGLNDEDLELKGLAEFIASVSKNIPWHVTAFHPDYKMMDRGVTPNSTLVKAYEIGKKAGLKYVYTGNTWDTSHENTFCPKCGEMLIEREGMSCLKINLKMGKGVPSKRDGESTKGHFGPLKGDEKNDRKCPKCGEKILGIWE